MITLKQKKMFSNNKDWAYLYAIADVYENYSSPYYDKEYNLYSPHPLKDYEVVQIIQERYGLETIHRNTILKYRNILGEFFGFDFKTNKKGRYLLIGSDNVNHLLFLASIAIERSRSLSNDDANQIIDLLANYCSNSYTKKCMLSIKRSDTGSPRKPIDKYSKEMIARIYDAKSRDKKISFEYKGDIVINKPLFVRIDANEEVYVECTYLDSKCRNQYLFKLIKNLRIIEKGRPKI